MMLSIGYLTCRKNPCWNWFFDSLRWQLSSAPFEILICDFLAQEIPHLNWKRADVKQRGEELFKACKNLPVRWFCPKPTVWAGPYRLTQNDYFSAANSRNTLIAKAHGTHVSFVDDLSVLMPGWLNAVREAMANNYIVCGAFRKVNKLVVENGEVKSFEDHPAGHDSRWKSGDDTRAVKCHPNWLFGCSLAGPVNAFLKINGWPEDCDSGGIGLEDCMTGGALVNTGHKLRYDRRMFTLESEELHHVDTPMLRKDKDRGKVVEVSPGVTHPAEKGHALVKRLTGATWFKNDFGPFPDLAALRQHVLAGGEMPVVGRPTHDWYDNQDLREM